MNLNDIILTTLYCCSTLMCLFLIVIAILYFIYREEFLQFFLVARILKEIYRLFKIGRGEVRKTRSQQRAKSAKVDTKKKLEVEDAEYTEIT